MPTTRSLAAAAGGLPAADPGWPALRRPRGSNRARPGSPERFRNRAEAVDNPGRTRNRTVAEGAIETVAEGGNAEMESVQLNNMPTATQGPPYDVWMGIHSCGVKDIAEAKILSKNLFLDSFFQMPRNNQIRH